MGLVWWDKTHAVAARDQVSTVEKRKREPEPESEFEFEGVAAWKQGIICLKWKNYYLRTNFKINSWV